MVCLCLAATLVAGPATALDGGRVTTKDLVALCNSAEDDASYNAAMAFCFAYLDAALDYHTVLTAGPDFEALTCPPETTTRDKVAVTFVQWAGTNSDAVGDGAPVHAVMQAVAETWPCTTD